MEYRLFLSLAIPDDTFYASADVMLSQWDGITQVAIARFCQIPIVADAPRDGENLLQWAITNLANAYDAAHPAMVKAFGDDVVITMHPVVKPEES